MTKNNFLVEITFNRGSPTVLKSDYHVQKDFFVQNEDYMEL